MSDNDLIRRGDAISALSSVALTYGATWEPHSVKLCKDAVRALPAVQETLQTELNEASARAAAAFEMAAEIVERRNGEIPERQEIAAAIRALPTDQERDALAKVRAEAMREAADWLVILETAAGEADLSERREGIRDAASAIRGRADKIEKGEA